MSTTTPIPDSTLCILHRISAEKEPETVCQVSKDRTTALVLFLIGIAFIGTGLYLLLAGVGTIPTLSIGCALLAAGSGCFFGGNFLFFKSIYNSK